MTYFAGKAAKIFVLSVCTALMLAGHIIDSVKKA